MNNIELDSENLAQAVAKFWRKKYTGIAVRDINTVARRIKSTLTSRNARHWLRCLGYNWREVRKGVYNDGHEREDVKNYRNMVFLPYMAMVKPYMLEWDEKLNLITKEIASNIRPMVLVTHDECTFNSNDGRHYIWINEEHTPLHKKGRGQGLHVSDFLTPIARLGDGRVCTILKCGGTIWWNGETMLEQITSKAIPEFEKAYPGCQALFAFDNAKNHQKFADDALRASEMNLGSGGKNAKIMRDGFNNQDNGTHIKGPQRMTLPDGTPKGLKIVLMERGLWPSNRRLLTQCSVKSGTGKSKLKKECLNGGTCCARALMANEPDFACQKSEIQETIEALGHCVIFYPKYHCELNFIEYFWGTAKQYARANCGYSYQDLKKMVPEALDSVPKTRIWKYWARSNRMMEAYRAGIVYGSEEFKIQVYTKYVSHRRVSLAHIA